MAPETACSDLIGLGAMFGNAPEMSQGGMTIRESHHALGYCHSTCLKVETSDEQDLCHHGYAFAQPVPRL
jgi:hypothetical protein